MDGSHVDIFAAQMLGEIVHHPLGRAEDECQVRLFVDEQMHEQSFLVPPLNGQEILLDQFDGQGAATGVHSRGIVHVFLGELFDFIADRRGNEDRLVLGFDGAEDFADVFAEADVEHPVDFIENDKGDVVEMQVSPIEHVHESAGRGDDDLRPFGEFILLPFDCLPAKHRCHANRGVLAKLRQLACDLNR